MSGVVARWVGGGREGAVGMLAVVVDTPAGARLVIAERTPEGWAPVRVVEATGEAVRMVGREDTPTTGEGGGDRLW